MISEDQKASYERMIRLLKATGLYRLDQNSAVEKELWLYAVYFGILEDQIKRLTDNCFVDSITRDGFDRYRELYSLPEGIKQSELRDIVRKRLAITNRDFTPAGVQRCMESGGFDVELTEYFQYERITIRVLESTGAFGTQEEKEAFLTQCLPCQQHASFLWIPDN